MSGWPSDPGDLPAPPDPERPDLPGAPEVPGAPDRPETPELPDVPGAPTPPGPVDRPETPEVPEVPDAPEAPDLPGRDDLPGTPDAPDVPDAPDLPDTPGAPELPGSELLPDTEKIDLPDSPGPPGLPPPGTEASGPAPGDPPGSRTAPPGATCAPCTKGVIEVSTAKLRVCWDSQPEGPDTEPLGEIDVRVSGPTWAVATATEASGFKARFEVPAGHYKISVFPSSSMPPDAPTYSRFGPERELDLAAGATESLEMALYDRSVECMRKHPAPAGGSQSGTIPFPLFFSPSAWPLFWIRDPLFVACAGAGAALTATGQLWSGAFLLSLAALLTVMIFGRVPGGIAMAATSALSFVLTLIAWAGVAGAGGVGDLPQRSPEFAPSLFGIWTAFSTAYLWGKTPRYDVYQPWPAPVFGTVGFVAGLTLLIAMLATGDHGYSAGALGALAVIVAAAGLTALTWRGAGTGKGLASLLLLGAAAVTVCALIGGADSGLALSILMMLVACAASGLMGHVFVNEGNLTDAELATDRSDGYALPFEGERYCVQGFRGIISHFASVYQTFAYDFAMPEGTPILAAKEGHVFAFREHNDHRFFLGGDPETQHANFILVRHRDGVVTDYHHLREGGVSELRPDLSALGVLVPFRSKAEEYRAVRQPVYVRAGDLLGASGNTGISAFPHLHVLVWEAGYKPMDRNRIYSSLPMYLDDASATRHGGRCWNMRKYRSSNQKLAYVDPATLEFPLPKPNDRGPLGS